MFDEYPISVVKFGSEHKDIFKNGYVNGSNVYIGRGSPLGNTYSHKDSKFKDVVKVDSRECAVDSFESDLYGRRLPDYTYKALSNIVEMSKSGPITLVCFCCPEKCHGDVIRKFIEERNS